MEKIRDDIKKISESKSLFGTLFVVGIFLFILLIFSAGIRVGFHKAAYIGAWDEHYNENFGSGARATRMIGIEMPQMMNYSPSAHGATGKIIKIENQNIILQGKDNTEKIVSTNTETRMQKGRTLILADDLRQDDFIVAIGTPDSSGIIEAKLIRVIPSPDFLK